MQRLDALIAIVLSTPLNHAVHIIIAINSIGLQSDSLLCPDSPAIVWRMHQNYINL